MDGHSALVEPTRDDPMSASPVDQLIICDERDTEHYLRLFPGLRFEQLKARIEAEKINRVAKVFLDCGEANWKHYLTLVRALWPEMRLEELPATEPGICQRQGRITLNCSMSYYMAIAKIAFHYYLVHSRRRVSGSELCFEPIRKFIIEGGSRDDKERFFLNRPVFATPYRRLPLLGCLTPSRWSHVLAADESGRCVLAYVQLFLGPGCIPLAHNIKLATLNNTLYLPGYNYAHVYEYYPEQAEAGVAGDVKIASISRM